MFSIKFPRMLVWLVLTIVLMAIALLLQATAPGNLVAVTLYKAHLLSLGGWGGYWLDRALFPYERPHEYKAWINVLQVQALASAQLRRAIIVAACLITVGLGA